MKKFLIFGLFLGFAFVYFACSKATCIECTIDQGGPDEDIQKECTNKDKQAFQDTMENRGYTCKEVLPR